MATLALVIAGLFTTIICLMTIGWATDSIPDGYRESAALRLSLSLTIIGVSMAVWWLARKSENAHLVTCKLGFFYQLITVFIVAYVRYALPRTAELIPTGASLAGVLIIVFPLFSPHASIRQAIMVAFMSAMMEPAALGLSIAHGTPVPTTMSWIGHVMPTFICAALAVIPALVFHRLSRDVNRAKRMGSYQLVERIGEGGMGEVWRAEHNMLARPAAVKLIRVDALGSGDRGMTTLRRFEREAQATAALQSPHTISLFDFGHSADGSFFYVMELLDGVDLETLVARFGPIPPERVLHLVRQVCDSLIEAHEAELVHRDIKPANIFICRYGHRTDFVKVLDFGLVKHSETNGAIQTRLTGENRTTGTPAFMAPEAALGKTDIDGRADLYALGCVAYWLLTGSLLFDGTSAVELAIQHVQEQPTPPSELSELPIPEELEAIVMWCLAKQPVDRPQTARELLRRLDAVALDESWSSDRSDAWWTKHLPADRSQARVTVERTVPRQLVPAR
jgi:serine/threonine-protein kinase